MAHAAKRGRLWTVVYKTGTSWRRIACGKQATKRDAEEIARRYSAIEINTRHEAPIRAVTTSIDDILESFTVAVKAESKSINSILREIQTIDRIKEYIKVHSISTLEAFDPSQYISYRLQSVGARSIKEEKRMLKKLYDYCISQSLIFKNPITDIVIPKKPKTHPHYFSADELAKIWAVAQEPYKSIFQFLYLTGLRSGELSNLSWDDWDGDLLKVRIVDGDAKAYIPGNKSKTEGSIPLCTDAVEILENQKKVTGNQSRIFLDDQDRPIRNNHLYRKLWIILKASGIKEGKVHSFRHSFCSTLVNSGVSIYTVAKLARHSSVTMTEIYAHVSNETTKSAVQVLTV